MHKLYIAFLSVILAILVGFALISAVDTNPTVSMVENRALSSAPEFTVKTLLNGSYMQEFETFYTDTFPFRENLLGLNKALNGFYHYSGGGEEEILIIQGSAGAAQGGESLATVEAALSGTVETPAPVTATSQDESVEIEVSTNGDDDLNPVQEPSEASVEAGAEESAPAPEEMPYLESPEENLAETLGNVLLVGDRAMDIPNATESVMDNYIAAVNGLATAMGEDVRTISLVTPNSGEFYSPDSFHTGSHSQSALIDYVYAGLDEDIVTVDAYSALRAQTDEYIYFRTDHHWTALGAYYAYRAYCESLRIMPVDLERFETGTYENFVGSMYTFTSGYAQSETLKNNPDYLTYYLPIVKTSAKYYADSTLTYGVPISVVYTGISDSVSNKYLCFIGGDTPICIVETDVEGPVCMVIKESYGNAFVPFLTSHYGKIIVVDPREFNTGGNPTLDLPAFATAQGVDDLLVINYPFMTNNPTYINRLNDLFQ